MRTSGGLRGPLNREVPPSDRPLAGSASSPLIGARGPGPSAYQSWREYRPPSVMAAAAVADSFSRGGSAAVRVPRSPPVKVLAEQLRRHTEGGPGAWRLSRAAAGRGPLELTAVWMQGTVLEADGGEARLRDPSGAFSVCGLDRVPRGRPCLAPGNRSWTRGWPWFCAARGQGPVVPPPRLCQLPVPRLGTLLPVPAPTRRHPSSPDHKHRLHPDFF